MSLRSEVIRIYNEIITNSKAITELPTASVIDGSEWIEIVQGGVNKKILISLIGTPAGPSVITSDLTTIESDSTIITSDQT